MKQTILLILFFATISQAQESFVAAGNTAVRNTGSISYSLGQVFDNSFENATQVMMLNEGVQQPYELFVVGDEFFSREEEEFLSEVLETINYPDGVVSDLNTTINYEYSIFPNPTTGNFTLEIENLQQNTPYSFLIYDSQGRSVIVDSIKNSQTSVDVSNLINGVFYLTVTEKGTPIKSFKLLKISQ